MDNRLRLYFFDKSGTLLKTTNDSGYRAFDYDGTLDRVVALRQTNQQGPTWADYYDIHGNKLDSLMITSGYVNRLRYSGNGKYLFYTEDDKSTIELIDLHGTRMFSKSGKGEIYCSPSGKLFGAILNRFQVGDNWYSKGAIWNLKGELVDSFTIAIHVDEFNFQVRNEAMTDKLQNQ
ncbi:MAG: hypothetical protein IPK94_16430 [Saprospiraceae bacterium]|nr:hypothetical protein [Saprospiraceae bacterium]